MAALAAGIIERHYRPKLLRLVETDPLAFPLYGEAGRWVRSPLNRWSDGFWPGTLWLAWHATGEAKFRAAAEACLARLAGRMHDARANFDVGFLYAYSFALGHDLTGESDYRAVAMAAADRLCDFVCEPAGVIAIDDPGPGGESRAGSAFTTIDVMMTLTLLWWAWHRSGDSRYREVARRHSERSQGLLLRPDGAVWQQADLDRDSGAHVASGTRRGASVRGCWARAQAWAIHGFAQAAHYTADMGFAATAGRALAHWQDNLPADAVPLWEFDAPQDMRDARDASAAAIVLAALVKAQSWALSWPGAEDLLPRTLAGLVERLTDASSDGVLGGGCAYYLENQGRHGATAWGDYYFLEALCGLAGPEDPATTFPG